MQQTHEPMFYFDVHTHHKGVHNTIQSLYSDFKRTGVSGYYSIGLHPWYITTQNFNKQLSLLKKYAVHSNVVAIGECGLDRVCKTDFDLQLLCFRQQVLLANELHKPIIVHCVRAYQEVVYILKSEKNKMPVVFHGYNRGAELANGLLRDGYYISFGAGIHTERTKAVFKQLPLNNIFFETDDADLNIETVYQAAAQIKQMFVYDLQAAIKQNAETVFGKIFTFI